MANLSLLLVDDEKPLLVLLRKYLERAGYKVDTAETAAGALALCSARPCPYALVVLDLKLPDMRGDQLLPLLLDTAPMLKVLISSGTPFSPEAVAAPYRARVGSIAKPFMPGQLTDAIAALIPAARAASV